MKFRHPYEYLAYTSEKEIDVGSQAVQIMIFIMIVGKLNLLRAHSFPSWD